MTPMERFEAKVKELKSEGCEIAPEVQQVIDSRKQQSQQTVNLLNQKRAEEWKRRGL